jgi:uncharacterized protein
MMRILMVSDVVSPTVYSANAKTRFAGVDLVLSCGDLPAYYLEFIVSMLNVPVFYVLGNHADELVRAAPVLPRDKVDDVQMSGPCGCTDLDGRSVNHRGLLIAGLQGSIWYNGGPYQYREDEMRRRVLLLRPQLVLNKLRYGRALDILITHSPPAGIHDDVDAAHKGFKAFCRLMDDVAPRYLIHGHKHVYTHGEQTVTQYHRTTVINAYGFRRLELEVTNT